MSVEPQHYTNRDDNEPATTAQPVEKKKEHIAQMFDDIAPKYDFLNRFLSVRIDKIWRRKAVNKLRGMQLEEVLDVASGTADLALALYKKLRPKHIIGIDISEEMLEIGRRKIQKKGLERQISLLSGDSENIPFETSSFDAVTVSFGVRNFEHLDEGLREIYRVLKPGGKLVILEFSVPRIGLFRKLYLFYFLRILPFVGRLVSKNNSAYGYLPDSVLSFPSGTEFGKILEHCGFSDVCVHSLSFGIACIYTGVKVER